jgi:hypothetical protein
MATKMAIVFTDYLNFQRFWLPLCFFLPETIQEPCTGGFSKD